MNELLMGGVVEQMLRHVDADERQEILAGVRACLAAPTNLMRHQIEEAKVLLGTWRGYCRYARWLGREPKIDDLHDRALLAFIRWSNDDERTVPGPLFGEIQEITP